MRVRRQFPAETPDVDLRREAADPYTSIGTGLRRTVRTPFSQPPASPRRQSFFSPKATTMRTKMNCVIPAPPPKVPREPLFRVPPRPPVVSEPTGDCDEQSWLDLRRRVLARPAPGRRELETILAEATHLLRCCTREEVSWALWQVTCPSTATRGPNCELLRTVRSVPEWRLSIGGNVCLKILGQPNASSSTGHLAEFVRGVVTGRASYLSRFHGSSSARPISNHAAWNTRYDPC